MTTMFDKLRSLELPAGDYAIFGSGPLAVRGIIDEARDLDVLCRDKAWDAVQRIGELRYLKEYDVSIVSMFDDTVSFGTVWGIGDFDVDELIDTAEQIDGLPFVRLEYVVTYKSIRRNGRDLTHLAALKESGLVE